MKTNEFLNLDFSWKQTRDEKVEPEKDPLIKQPIFQIQLRIIEGKSRTEPRSLPNSIIVKSKHILRIKQP